MGFERFSTATLRDFISQQVLYHSNAGAVIKAQYKYDEKWYVLKQRKVSELGHSKNILNEVQLLMQLNHPNVVRCFGHFWEDGRTSLYIVLEYCSGGDLMALISAHRKTSEYFEESFIWSLFYQICDGLKHLHENGIVHRDIKSLNILLTRDNQVPKLADLGVSKQLSSDTTLLRTFYGTPLYLSPELIDGQHYTEKTDIWSMGVLLYELAALQMPFMDTSIVKLAQRIKQGVFAPLPSHYSKKLTQTIKWMLNIDFSKRPSILAIMNRIEPYLDVKLRNDIIRNAIADPVPASPVRAPSPTRSASPIRSSSPTHTKSIEKAVNVSQSPAIRHSVILPDVEAAPIKHEAPATDTSRVDANRIAVLLKRENQTLRRLYQNKTLVAHGDNKEISACQERIQLLEECVSNNYHMSSDDINRFPMLREAAPTIPVQRATEAVSKAPKEPIKSSQRSVVTVAPNVHVLHYDAFKSPPKGIFRDNRSKHTVFAARTLHIEPEVQQNRPRTAHTVVAAAEPSTKSAVPASALIRPTTAAPATFLDKGVQQQKQFRRKGHADTHRKPLGKYNIISGSYEDA